MSDGWEQALIAAGPVLGVWLGSVGIPRQPGVDGEAKVHDSSQSDEGCDNEGLTGVAYLAELVERDMFDERVAEFLRACVRARLSMVFAGAPGSGKTTMLS